MSCTTALPAPSGPGYWVRNAHGWWGPYNLSELAELCDPQPDESVYAVGAGRDRYLGRLVSRRGVGRWVHHQQWGA